MSFGEILLTAFCVFLGYCALQDIIKAYKEIKIAKTNAEAFKDNK